MNYKKCNEQHKQLYILLSCVNRNNVGLQLYLQLEGDESTSVTQKRMPNQREQYGSTVHLFIGTGRSACKITYRPFAFDNNSIVIYRGLDSIFLFKSVSSFLPSCRSSLAHSFGSVRSFVFFPCFFIQWVLVRRSLSTHYTLETLLNHVFEDLRKPKAPNSSPSQY